MKKVFKKATATVTAAAMLASLTACGGGAASSATTAAPAADSKAEGGAETTEAAASGIDNKDIKIGVSIWSSMLRSLYSDFVQHKKFSNRNLPCGLQPDFRHCPISIHQPVI